MASPSEIPPDHLLAGKIRLLKRIGRGGMGDVWVARNEATQAEVAVKTLPRSERTDTHEERFRREARLAATISHRNVVRIFDLIDDDDGTLALVMELLRGGTLEASIRDRGPMSALHSIAVAAPILSALNHVHQKGIVHRDVKPANIFFAVEPDGHVIPKVLDFGIAKLPVAGSSLTVDGSVLGTPHYMSPEQIRGAEDLDGRSDMFSLASVLFEMLTGERAFQRDSAAASLAAVLEHDVDPDPRIEPRVWVALARALAKRPYERFATCAEFADALRRAVDATDEDFALALQELRPRSSGLPEWDGARVSGEGSGPRLRATPKAEPPEAPAPTPAPKGGGRVLVAAGAAALLAVAATLAATRLSAPARGNVPAARSAAGSGSVGEARAEPLPSAPPLASGELLAVTSTAVSVPSSSGSGERTAPSAGAQASGSRGVPSGVARLPTARPVPLPPPSSKPRPQPSSGATGPRPIATSPGF